MQDVWYFLGENSGEFADGVGGVPKPISVHLMYRFSGYEKYEAEKMLASGMLNRVQK
jgi:hypothetical protein